MPVRDRAIRLDPDPGTGPTFIPLGDRRIGYGVDALDGWIATREP